LGKTVIGVFVAVDCQRPIAAVPTSWAWSAILRPVLLQRESKNGYQLLDANPFLDLDEIDECGRCHVHLL
jgi:hypothetical protein